MAKRVPIGPCAFITTFNFPLNLVAHKVAPAIAAGCPFVLKPAAKTPVGALIIGAVLADTDLPQSAFSILPCSNDDGGLLVCAECSPLRRFTQSDECSDGKEFSCTCSTLWATERKKITKT